MRFVTTKRDLDKYSIKLSFKKIKSFDELLISDLDDVCYISNDTGYGYSQDICSTRFKKKKRWFCGQIYFELNDSTFEYTEVTRDNFHCINYSFYKMYMRLDKK